MMIKASYQNPDTGKYTEITGELQGGLCQITDSIIKALVDGADVIQITRMSFEELIETAQAAKGSRQNMRTSNDKRRKRKKKIN